MKSYYLIGGDDTVYLIPSRKTVTLGRALINQIVLDDCCVSRMHALITPSTEGPMLTDCGSTNGSFVNGRSAGEILLHHGDSIQLGKYVFFVLHGSRAEVEQWTQGRSSGSSMSQTQPIESTESRRTDAKNLVGDLSAFEVVTLLQALAEQRRDGCLELRIRRRLLGHVYFADGAIVHAETPGGAKGKEALFELMTTKQGQFVFYPESRSTLVSIFQPTTALLLEGCQRIDEMRSNNSQS